MFLQFYAKKIEFIRYYVNGTVLNQAANDCHIGKLVSHNIAGNWANTKMISINGKTHRPDLLRRSAKIRTINKRSVRLAVIH